MANTTVGTAIKTKGRRHLAHLLLEILGFKGTMAPQLSRSKLRIVAKAGVPASDTAADSPGGKAFIIDTANNDVYFCHTWTNTSSFTVVKVSN